MITSDLEQPDLIESVRCTDHDLVVALKDGRTISVPLWWYPRLLRATPEQRAQFEIGRFGIHWPEIDEDIELAGLLVGAKAPGAKPPAADLRVSKRPRKPDLYDGVIYFIEELKRCEAADAKIAAVLMVLIGIDTMAFLSLPAGQNAQSREHFIAWADKYMKAHPDQSYSYAGLDLYAARCSALHCFTAEGDFHRRFPEAMRYVFSDGGKHYASRDSRLVIIGSLSLINDFVLAVDAFLTDIQNDAASRERVEARLPRVYARRPFPPPERTTAEQV